MRKFIFFFLGMFFPQQAAAITQIVNAGEVLDGGDVHIVVTQRVYGTTKIYGFGKPAGDVRRRGI